MSYFCCNVLMESAGGAKRAVCIPLHLKATDDLLSGAIYHMTRKAGMLEDSSGLVYGALQPMCMGVQASLTRRRG